MSGFRMDDAKGCILNTETLDKMQLVWMDCFSGWLRSQSWGKCINFLILSSLFSYGQAVQLRLSEIRWVLSFQVEGHPNKTPSSTSKKINEWSRDFFHTR